MSQEPDQDSDMIEPTSEAENDVTDLDPANVAPRRTLFFRFWKYAYRKFPSFVSDPYFGERLKVYRRRDAEGNARSEPPTDEVIDLRCVWAVEFYTPSQIAKLIRGIESLGWNNDDSLGFRRNPTHWIQRNRESSHGGGWFNLGPIQRPDGDALFGFSRKAPLPVGVKYATAAMYSLTSSITCIVVGFVLDETHNRCFEQALRQERQTYLKPGPKRSFAIVDPFAQKERDIKKLRADLRELASGWLYVHLPGLFASGILGGEYPTCEFLTLRKTIPLTSVRSHKHSKDDEWLRILRADRDFNAWESDKLNGLKFVWPLSHEIYPRFHSIVAAREDDFSDETLQVYGGNNRQSLVFYVDRFINGVLSRWALLGLLSGFERYLNNARDSADYKSHKKSKLFLLLKSLGNHIAQSVDISAAAVELQRFAARDEILFTHNINIFYPCDRAAYRNQDITLSEALRAQTARRAEWLHNVDQSIRDVLIQYGSTIGAYENIKLQKRLTGLTWIIILLTIVMAFATGISTILSIKEGTLSWPW